MKKESQVAFYSVEENFTSEDEIMTKLLKKLKMIPPLLILFCSSVLFAGKECEVWWEECLGKDVSLMTFEEWIEDLNGDSRKAMRQHFQKMGYRSVLMWDAASVPTILDLLKIKIPVDYLGVDVTLKLVEMARSKGVNATVGSVEELPLEDSQFDVAYSREVFEHLEYYEFALSELIRVASREVMVVFFIKPNNEPDRIWAPLINGHPIYHNSYNRKKMEKFITDNKKVTGLEWQNINDKQVLLHIYLDYQSPITAKRQGLFQDQNL